MVLSMSKNKIIQMNLQKAQREHSNIRASYSTQIMISEKPTSIIMFQGEVYLEDSQHVNSNTNLKPMKIHGFSLVNELNC